MDITDYNRLIPDHKKTVRRKTFEIGMTLQTFRDESRSSPVAGTTAHQTVNSGVPGLLKSEVIHLYTLTKGASDASALIAHACHPKLKDGMCATHGDNCKNGVDETVKCRNARWCQ